MKQRQEESATRRLEATVAVKTTIRTPMPIRMRAKQLAMFDALKGLTEAIAEKEQRYVPRKELSEERITEINQTLGMIQPEDTITVTYYCQYRKDYYRLSGVVTKIDLYSEKLLIDDVPIRFSEVYEITYRNNANIPHEINEL